MGEEQHIVELLDYDVVYVSGKKMHEPGNAREATDDLLNGRGWLSTGHCHYPQKLILKFPTKSAVRKIQVLVHHQFIPTKINFSTSDETPEAKEDFDDLGVADFRDNKTTDFSARELKTIFLDTESLYLKLTVHKPHLNKYNEDNQVGVMGIEIYGYPLDSHNNHAHSMHRPRTGDDLIARDRERRISTVSLKQRMGTAKARHLLERNYAQELVRVQDILNDKLEHGGSKEREKLTPILEELSEVKSNAMLLLQEERSAMGEADEEFAEACEHEIKHMCSQAYSELKIYDMLSKDELRDTGLDKFKSKHSGSSKPSSSHRRSSSSSRADSGHHRRSASRNGERRSSKDRGDRPRSQSKSRKR